jgi:peroxiredoxin Q/BCP
MKTFGFWLTQVAWVTSAVLLLAAAEPKIGEMAPDFSVVGSDGRTYRLSEFRGKQAVVLAWFAKAFTSG